MHKIYCSDYHFLFTIVIYDSRYDNNFMANNFILVIVSTLAVISSNKLINTYSKGVGDKKIKYDRIVTTGVSEGITLAKPVKVFGIENRIIEFFNFNIKKYINVLSKYFVLSRMPIIFSEIINVAIVISSIIIMIIYTNISIKELIPIIAVFVVIGSRVTTQMGAFVKSKWK